MKFLVSALMNAGAMFLAIAAVILFLLLSGFIPAAIISYFNLHYGAAMIVAITWFIAMMSVVFGVVAAISAKAH